MLLNANESRRKRIVSYLHAYSSSKYDYSNLNQLILQKVIDIYLKYVYSNY